MWEFLMGHICVHVPMSLLARTSVPDEWWIFKVNEKMPRFVMVTMLNECH